MEEVAHILEQNGFIRMSDEKRRISLNKGYTKEGFADKVYHIHLRYTGDNDELYFRDYLNEKERKALSGQTVLLGQNCENAGGVDIWLDEIVPCLKDTQTGEIKETVVFKIESRSFLKKFMEKDGFVLNKEFLNHYIVVLGASYLGAQHPYQFLLDGDAARKFLEVYTYEWN